MTNKQAKPFVYKQAHLNLIKYVLDLGYSVEVFDGEEMFEKNTSFKAIKAASEGAEESHLYIYDSEGEKAGYAYVVLGNEPEELVCDYSDDKVMNDWHNNYNSDFTFAN